MSASHRPFGRLVILSNATLPLVAASDYDVRSGEAPAVQGQQAEDIKDLDSAPETVAQARLESREKSPFGRYLTDRNGMSLYMFEKDEQGGDSSTCYQGCAIARPPYATEQPPEAGEHVEEDS